MMKRFVKKFLEIKEDFFDFPGRYGEVVTKKDWNNIKKNNPEFYREIRSEEASGYCYYYSRELALLLKDTKLMYCSIDGEDGGKTAHAVLLKNDYVYCTNSQQHYYLDVYKKFLGAEVYKVFSEDEYGAEDFFNKIRDDFVKWCAERNVSCNFQ